MRVYKLDAHGEEVLHYDGTVIERGESWVCLRAVFQVGTVHVGGKNGITLEKGDVFIEWFYADRWYNIFRIEHGSSGALKGWYCNVTRPAAITADSVRSDDLALDMLVLPDGAVTVLDEDEFAALALRAAEKQAARDAVEQIRAQVKACAPPFNDICGTSP